MLIDSSYLVTAIIRNDNPTRHSGTYENKLVTKVLIDSPDTVLLSEIMSVKMFDPTNGHSFNIIPLSKETQRVVIHTDRRTYWQWYLTPIEIGKKILFLYCENVINNVPIGLPVYSKRVYVYSKYNLQPILNKSIKDTLNAEFRNKPDTTIYDVFFLNNKFTSKSFFVLFVSVIFILIIILIILKFMRFFDRKIKCEKFFTYKTNTIDISGLSAGLSSEQLAGFDLKVGQFKLDPKFVLASEKLQQLDLLQYSTCQTISGISSKEKRDELLIKLAEIKMQMLLIAQNPEKAEEIKIQETVINNQKQNEMSECKELKNMLVDNKSVGKALKMLQSKLPDENATILFLSEYNQLSEEIQIGTKTFTSPEWRSLIHRISQFIDMKCND